MVERVRSARLAEPEVLEPKQTSREQRTVAFVQWPRAALINPPVRHRGDDQDKGLTVFELAVAGAVMLLARPALAEKRHAAAMKKGKRGIDGRKSSPSRRGEWLDKKTYRRMQATYTPQHAGGAHYEQGQIDFDGRRDTVVIRFRTSAAAIMRAAGLGRNKRSVAALTRALDRLKRDVRAHPALPPVLVEWRRQGSRLELSASGLWLPAKNFGRVPWPPPTRGGGSGVLALYLFAHGTDQRRGERRAMIDFTTLVHRLGARVRTSAEANRALDEALRAVNRHLESLGAEALAAHELPPGFAVREVEGAVRIVALADHNDHTEKAAETDAELEPITDDKDELEPITDSELHWNVDVLGLSPRRHRDARQQRVQWQLERMEIKRDDR